MKLDKFKKRLGIGPTPEPKSFLLDEAGEELNRLFTLTKSYVDRLDDLAPDDNYRLGWWLRRLVERSTFDIFSSDKFGPFETLEVSTGWAIGDETKFRATRPGKNDHVQFMSDIPSNYHEWRIDNIPTKDWVASYERMAGIIQWVADLEDWIIANLETDRFPAMSDEPQIEAALVRALEGKSLPKFTDLKIVGQEVQGTDLAESKRNFENWKRDFG
jgi:hypothetical protein